MTQTNTTRRQCPTRQDGEDTLIAHWITTRTCSDRQHRNYHKCLGCTYGYSEAVNVIVPLAPLPKPAATKKNVEEKPAAAAAAV